MRNLARITRTGLICALAFVSSLIPVVATTKSGAVQQHKTSAAAYNDEFGDPEHGPFKVGMSFNKWKQVQEKLGFKNSIKQISTSHAGISSYSISRPSTALWGHLWTPVFTFVNDREACRLVQMTGAFQPSDTRDLVHRLVEQYGEPTQTTRKISRTSRFQ